MKKKITLCLLALLALSQTAFAAITPFRLSLWGKNLALPPVGTVYGLDFGIGTSADIKGLQLTLFYAGAENAIGVQNSLVAQAQSIKGLQMSFVNLGETVMGAQVGFFNKAAKMAGAQVGVINMAKQMKGIQFGLVNIISESDLPFMVLLNMKF